MRTVGIIGLGCIGGSLGLSLTGRQGWHVLGYDTDRKAMERALERGACHSVAGSQKQLAEECQIVVIAVPCSEIAGVAREVAPAMKSGHVLTDTGSVKKPLLDQVLPYLPEGVTFVGGHPMAGSEKWGIESASHELFKGATWVLTPTSPIQSATRSALKVLKEMVRAVEAVPLVSDAAEHDAVVAFTSHLPYIASLALALTARTGAMRYELVRQLVAGGFRDMTRLARSRPGMASDYVVMNRNSLISAINEFQKQLDVMKSAIEAGDGRALRSAATEAGRYLESVNWGKYNANNPSSETYGAG
ncbi:MAG TPA: prephenate dehydrogenase [Firmicutes bacterium]|nr:prephenate dehydrogenase [Bacillota bacterium]